MATFKQIKTYVGCQNETRFNRNKFCCEIRNGVDLNKRLPIVIKPTYVNPSRYLITIYKNSTVKHQSLRFALIFIVCFSGRNPKCVIKYRYCPSCLHISVLFSNTFLSKFHLFLRDQTVRIKFRFQRLPLYTQIVKTSTQNIDIFITRKIAMLVISAHAAAIEIN